MAIVQIKVDTPRFSRLSKFQLSVFYLFELIRLKSLACLPTYATSPSTNTSQVIIMTDVKPTILVFGPEESEGSLKEPKEKANVYHASLTKFGAADKLLDDHPTPRAIFILDPAIVTPDCGGFSDRITDYTFGGGTVVLGGSFSLYVSQSDFDTWMEEEWNLPWKCGNRERTRVVFQSSAVGPRDFWRDGLVAAYTHDGQLLKNVSPSDSWYATLPNMTNDPVQTSVACAKYGEGWLGWTGDFRNRDETIAAVRVMMDLNTKHEENGTPPKLISKLLDG
ncbi:hypothetical protein F4818DRAFT_405037 [Hypoxylon cercidicola]|nr:hypothetical protein F4818DRAFT_405037 [Hypoxylon cercidicola]